MLAIEFTGRSSFRTRHSGYRRANRRVFPSVPTSRATRVTSETKDQLIDHGVDGVFQRNFAAYVDRDLARQIATGETAAVATSAILRTCAVRFPAMKLTLSVKSLPRTRDARHLFKRNLPSVPTSRIYGDFSSESVELIHHRVDGVFQFENLALHIHRDLAAINRREPQP